MQLLDQQYFNPFYGCRKLTFWLKDLGFKVNRKRVRRLMQIINWQTIYREPKTTMSNKEHKKHPYLLKDLKISHKKSGRATDITYIPMAKGFMYLTAIIDLHTRFVLNGAYNTMSADLCRYFARNYTKVWCA
jgi:putative transposase